jgi:hypothetical protein
MSRIKKLLEAFDTPREWFGWAVFLTGVVLLVLGFLDGWQALMWAVYSGVIHKWIKSGSVGPATIGGNDDDQD